MLTIHKASLIIGKQYADKVTNIGGYFCKNITLLKNWIGKFIGMNYYSNQIGYLHEIYDITEV